MAGGVVHGRHAPVTSARCPQVGDKLRLVRGDSGEIHKDFVLLFEVSLQTRGAVPQN